MKILTTPKAQLEQAWAMERERYNPDAVHPPQCLRCGFLLDAHRPVNALSRCANVEICESCGTAEGLGSLTGQLPLKEWHAITSGRIYEAVGNGAAALSTTCVFDALFMDREKIDPREMRDYPKREAVYCRTYYTEYTSYNRWFKIHSVMVDGNTALVEEIDAFVLSLFKLPEFKSLGTLTAYCGKSAAPTADATEFNLYSQTEHFHIWLRLITRKGDYNVYTHFFLK